MLIECVFVAGSLPAAASVPANGSAVTAAAAAAAASVAEEGVVERYEINADGKVVICID